MHRYLLLLTSLILISCSKEKAATTDPKPKSEKIFFNYMDNLYSVEADGSHLEKVFVGYDVSASKDGKFVVYTTYHDSANQRSLAIYTIATKQKTLLKDIPGSNNYQATFSPDDKKLLFSHFDDSSADWQVAVVDIDGSNYHIVASQKQKHFSGYFSPRWLSDQSGFLCHNLDTVYQFDMSGKLTAQYPSNSLVDVNKYGISSSTVFYHDTRKNRLYFEAGSDMEDSNEILPYGIFTYDLATKTTKLISPDSIHAYNPIWNEASGRFYFIGYSKNDFFKLSNRPNDNTGNYDESEFGAHTNLFSVKEDGSDLKKVVPYQTLEHLNSSSVR